MDSDPDIRRALEETKRIAVVGMRDYGAAAYVPRYMAAVGYEIIPVNPAYDELFGLPVLDSLDDLEEPVEMVNLFRRSGDVPGHLDEILRANPRYVWMQQGISNEAVAEKLRAAGIGVVQDSCLMVEHRRLFGQASPLG